MSQGYTTKTLFLRKRNRKKSINEPQVIWKAVRSTDSCVFNIIVVVKSQNMVTLRSETDLSWNMRDLSQLEYVWRKQANDKKIMKETISCEEPENEDSVLPHPKNNNTTKD